MSEERRSYPATRLQRGTYTVCTVEDCEDDSE